MALLGPHRRGEKRRRRAWRTLVAGMALLGASCERPPADASTSAAASAPARTRTTAEPLWHALGTWSGHGSGQTGSFDVGTGSLRVTWEAKAGATATNRFLTVVLHSAISGRPLQTVIDVHEPGAGMAFVQDEPRVSYLEVTAPGMDWRLTVEEMSQRPAGQ